jgi:acetyl-CoA carboxylase carboxyl transferase subunit alpha
MHYLEFEKDLEQLDKSLEELKHPFNEEGGLSTVNNLEIDELENKIKVKIDEIYSNLDGWKKTKIARHENRPKAEFYISSIFENFQQVAGDRNFGEDDAAITGFAKINGESVLVIGQEKGNDTQSRIKRNFGMMRPEGYRKCIRLMKLAENYNVPVITFIDTPGAYPGKGAEERGQAEAIAQSINCCLGLKVPIISIVIGEGGSGGAIALATSNKVLMLEHSIYSVISPEGCASILWKDATKSKDAAEAMHLTSQDLFKYEIIDGILTEPKGGAHRNPDLMSNKIKEEILKHIQYYKSKASNEILNERTEKFKNVGNNLPADLVSFDGFSQSNIKDNFNKNKKKIYIGLGIFLITILGLYFFLN